MSWKTNLKKKICVALLLGMTAAMSMAAEAAEKPADAPIVLKTMGSTFFGGTVTTQASGETFHGDHGYAQFYIPAKARDYPLIFWHGIGQTGRSFESTPDGREGFQAIMTRRDWAVYIIDQPRRGRAGRTTAEMPDASALVPTLTRESSAWNAFRNGVWTPPAPPRLYKDSQFPNTPAAVEQFFRQQAPDTGDEPVTAQHRAFMGKTMAALLEKTGPAILITHSNSGQYGWEAGMEAPDKVKAIVAFEPGAFAFPEGERPADIAVKAAGVKAVMEPRMVSQERFAKLLQIPIVIVYGDHIAKEPSEVFNVDIWRVSNARAKQFAETVNRHGGNAKLVMLPELGIRGNTHAPFADLNNLAIADVTEALLRDLRVDGRAHPHQGPQESALPQYTIPVPIVEK